ncbi:hypothetical protein QR680_009895 [Steinernema hermaphroditum]|uniref:Uncharacterized protein n=1 Tax=Steinernema hermaphroditum TaxID=289476 RepID=A0AA39INP5_9BILA|nr:hypothetical protein QR680_009895 [Steinernema hermaphroditum]
MTSSGDSFFGTITTVAVITTAATCSIFLCVLILPFLICPKRDPQKSRTPTTSTTTPTTSPANITDQKQPLLTPEKRDRPAFKETVSKEKAAIEKADSSDAGSVPKTAPVN